MIFFLLHAFLSTGLAFILSSVQGSLSPWIAAVSLLLGVVIARDCARSFHRTFNGPRLFQFAARESGVIEAILTITIIYVSVRHFLWLFFELDTHLMTLSPNNFGDLPLHINYIREIANGLTFPPVNPSFASEPLRYPFGSDLYNALWECLGVPISSHLFVVGVFSSLVSLAVLRWFGSWWALGAFFFSGGLAGWHVLQAATVSGAAFGALSDDALREMSQNVDWKNLFLAVFITQRGVLFALPAGLILIEATRRIHFDQAKPTKKVMTTLGCLWGLLPLFHLHAFVIVSLIMVLTVISSIKPPLTTKLAASTLSRFLTSRMAGVAAFPAIWFVLRSSDGMKKVSVLHWHAWWTSSTAEAPRFLLLNFGPWLALPLILFITISRTKRFTKDLRRTYLIELLIYSALFVVFFNVMLAPWAWDNIKLLIFPYLGFARLACAVLDPVMPSAAKYLTALILFFSGFLAVELSLSPPSARGLVIYSRTELGAFQTALKTIPINAVFAAAPTHDHALTYFGRVRAVGYEGHLWSHGIDYKQKLARLNDLMKAVPGRDFVQAAHSLGANYIVWGPAEARFFETEPSWPKTFKTVARVGAVQIYEVPK